MDEKTQAKKLVRVLRVPLEHPDKETWQVLQQCARDAADFCNQLLAEWWMRQKYGQKKEPSTFIDFNDRLSSYVREAANDQLKGITRRLGRRVLNGDLQLPTFTRERALMLRCDKGHVGARLHGPQVLLQPRPAPAAWIELRVWEPALRRDWFLAETLQAMETGAYSMTRAALRFVRGKTFLHLTYAKPAETEQSGNTALLVCNETGELWLRKEGRALNLTHLLYRLAEMKLHFAAIQSRLRRCLGKAGKRRTLRKALLARQSYVEWAEGPIRQLAAAAVKWCEQQGAGRLEITLPSDGVLPWFRIKSALRNACEAAGIATEEVDDENLKKDWGRIAEMAQAQRKLLALGPAYGIHADLVGSEKR